MLCPQLLKYPSTLRAEGSFNLVVLNSIYSVSAWAKKIKFHMFDPDNTNKN
ncbi:hypothetical protein GCM10023150_00310 [Kangiella taiwanensis]|uniref:Uncharacterized protein n=1 Tax=Kangiella taiwanensis TaxID=1079179 RepID=A0ABP8HQ07_9GAMM